MVLSELVRLLTPFQAHVTFVFLILNKFFFFSQRINKVISLNYGDDRPPLLSRSSEES